jgi:hypothetical protein
MTSENLNMSYSDAFKHNSDILTHDQIKKQKILL